MKASDKIKELIKGWEGLRLTAYRCPAGVWTIGYGHTGTDVRAGQRITPAQARALFESDLTAFESALTRELTRTGVTLTQNRYDALLSFAYNVGLSKLTDSTLWRKMEANPDDPGIATEFSRWIYGGGRKLPGLVKRRAKEAMIWACGSY